MRLPLYIQGPGGLGDCIYERPFVHALTKDWDIWLETPWPELYTDLGIRFVKHRETYLRTQAKNMARWSDWSEKPSYPHYRWKVGGFWTDEGSIVESFARQLPAGRFDFTFDLPDMGPSPVTSEKPVAVIRPNTVRREWNNPARLCKPEYIAEAARQLRARGFHVVSVADVDPPKETFQGEMPEYDEAFHAGELDVRRLLALIRHADLVVGSVGWIAPASIATRTPVILIGGGNGFYNAPEKVTDRRMDTSMVRWLLPNSYCRCKHMEHRCRKEISDFAARFAETVNSLTLVAV